MLALAIATANAQPTFTTPQSVTSANFFSGVSTAQASAPFTNLGQTVHFVFYQATGVTGNVTNLRIRIEGSFDGTTYFAISDDGGSVGQNGTGMILGLGSYPFIRANLLVCGCDAADTITASYTGTSAIPGNPFGLYGAGQQIRKVAWNSATNTITSPKFTTPYGSGAGFFLIQSNASGQNFTAGTLLVRCQDIGGSNIVTATLPTTAGVFLVPVPATTCLLVDVRCNLCTVAGGNSYNGSWFFFPPGGALPGGAQPINTVNSEATAAANTAVVTTLTVGSTQRGHLFKVNARCSAGTAQLTVADGATQIYSTAATEVGTTSFKDSWTVGLASTAGNNLVITLGTCGVANTGTLDVQGSVF